MSKRKTLKPDKDMGEVVSIEKNGFRTSTGMYFDFPFDMPKDLTVEELNKHWQSWCKNVDKMIKNGTIGDFLDG